MKEEIVKIDPILAGLIVPDQIMMVDGATRAEVLEVMGKRLLELHPFCEETLLLKALFAREELVSTGIGMGIAIPHARLLEGEGFYVQIALSCRPEGIAWPSLDGLPVRLLFMIIGSKDRPNEFLKLLAALTGFLRYESIRTKLLQSKTAKEFYDYFQSLTAH